MFRTQRIPAVVAATIVLAAATAIAQQPLPAEGDEAQLLEVLQSDAPLFDKAKACQRLAIIGTDKAVPVLADMLSDEKLSHYARIGLETNPSSDVDAAFREALGTLSGQPLIGVINSIGVRRDEGAVDALIEITAGDNQKLSIAANAALGKIASPKAVEAVTKSLKDQLAIRSAAADACLTAADVLLREGKHAEAAEIFDAVRKSDLPEHINVAARFGEIRVGTGDLKDLMAEYLKSDDDHLFRIGLELAHEIEGDAATQLLLDQLNSLPTDRQILLIYVLGDRGDSAALSAVIAAAKRDDAQIRIAAARVLAALGDRSVLPLLMTFATSADEDLASAARDSLAEISGDSINAQLLDRLTKSEGATRIVLVDVVGRRGITAAVPVLLRLAASDDNDMRNAAIESLGMTVGLKELAPLVDRLIGPSSTETAEATKEALRKACQRMPDRDAAADVLLRRMSDASAAAKVELMDLLVYVGGEKALAGAGAAGKSEDVATADAATRALGKWLTPDAGPVLLELAQDGNEQFRIRCLRGYIRIIRQFGLPARRRLQMSREAFAAATRDEERKLVLDTLTRFPSPAALNMTVPHLNTPTLKDDACKAAVAIGEKIVNTNPKQVASAMAKVVAATSDPDLSSRAQVLVTRAEAKLDP